jgi:hypothetical protein
MRSVEKINSQQIICSPSPMVTALAAIEPKLLLKILTIKRNDRLVLRKSESRLFFKVENIFNSKMIKDSINQP